MIAIRLNLDIFLIKIIDIFLRASLHVVRAEVG